jgi:type I restriction enzyme R subunit
LYTDEDQLRTLRANPEAREGLLTRLQRIGIDEEQLANLKKMFEAEDSDIFDILAHISFNANIKKRVQRVEYVRNHHIVLEEYQNLQAKEFLEFILEQYARYGIVELQARHLGKLVELYHRGSVSDMAKVF